MTKLPINLTPETIKKHQTLCPDCDGDGYIGEGDLLDQIPGLSAPCPLCKGSGEVRECPVCEGYGHIINTPVGGHWPEKTNCTTCHGEGVIGGGDD